MGDSSERLNARLGPFPTVELDPRKDGEGHAYGRASRRRHRSTVARIYITVSGSA